MNRIANRIAVAALFSSLGLAPAYAAGPLMNFTGSTCTSTGAAGQSSANAEIFNYNASSISLVCPMVRLPQPTSGATTASTIWLHDQHYSQDVCCSSRAKDPGGQSVKFTATQCSSGVVYNKLLTFTGPTPSGSWSPRFFLCSVPGTYSGNPSGILAFQSQEQ